MHIQSSFVQQCVQISTRINSSMYIRTSVFVSFETTSSSRIYILHYTFSNGLLTNNSTGDYRGVCPSGSFFLQRFLERWLDVVTRGGGSLYDKWWIRYCDQRCCVLGWLHGDLVMKGYEVCALLDCYQRDHSGSLASRG